MKLKNLHLKYPPPSLHHRRRLIMFLRNVVWNIMNLHPVVTLQAHVSLTQWDSIRMLFYTNSYRAARASLYPTEVSPSQTWTLVLACLFGRWTTGPMRTVEDVWSSCWSLNLPSSRRRVLLFHRPSLFTCFDLIMLLEEKLGVSLSDYSLFWRENECLCQILLRADATFHLKNTQLETLVRFMWGWEQSRRRGCRLESDRLGVLALLCIKVFRSIIHSDICHITVCLTPDGSLEWERLSHEQRKRKRKRKRSGNQAAGSEVRFLFSAILRMK